VHLIWDPEGQSMVQGKTLLSPADRGGDMHDRANQSSAIAPQPSLSGSPGLNFTAPMPGTVTLHRASGIVSTCLFGTFKGEWATGTVEGIPFDTFLLSRGSNRSCHGTIGGEQFRREPHGTLLISFIPQGLKGELTYWAEANPSSLLMFPPGRLANMMPGNVDASRRPIAMLDNQRLVELFQMIETEILTPNSGRPGHIETLTRMLAQELAKGSEAQGTTERANMEIGPHKLKRVLDFIDDHLGEPVDLDAMAAVTGLSRFYFASVFKRATGRSPYQHLLSRRVAHAQTLIAQSTLSLREIGEASGFASPAHFSASFRRKAGLSPTRYRDLVRQGVEVPGEVIAGS
jgi:AraC-like DNA-binding protein